MNRNLARAAARIGKPADRGDFVMEVTGPMREHDVVYKVKA
jgi:hypothetical protein